MLSLFSVGCVLGPYLNRNLLLGWAVSLICMSGPFPSATALGIGPGGFVHPIRCAKAQRFPRFKAAWHTLLSRDLFPAYWSSCSLLDGLLDCLHPTGTHEPPPLSCPCNGSPMGLLLAEVQGDPSSMGVTGRIFCAPWSRKSHKSLNLLIFVLVCCWGRS